MRRPGSRPSLTTTIPSTRADGSRRRNQEQAREHLVSSFPMMVPRNWHADHACSRQASRAPPFDPLRLCIFAAIALLGCLTRVHRILESTPAGPKAVELLPPRHQDCLRLSRPLAGRRRLGNLRDDGRVWPASDLWVGSPEASGATAPSGGSNSSRSAPDQLPCHAVSPAFLHEKL